MHTKCIAEHRESFQYYASVALRNLARQRRILTLALDGLELALEEGDRFEKDAVHFTAAGNRAIARQVAAVVGPLLNAE